MDYLEFEKEMRELWPKWEKLSERQRFDLYLLILEIRRRIYKDNQSDEE